MGVIGFTDLIYRKFDSIDECIEHFASVEKISPAAITGAIESGKPVSIGIRRWYFDEIFEG